MTGLSRGRIALPPRHDEGDAFVAGGGKASAQAEWQPVHHPPPNLANRSSASGAPSSRARSYHLQAWAAPAAWATRFWLPWAGEGAAPRSRGRLAPGRAAGRPPPPG